MSTVTVLTAALVLITAYYAVQNQRMVKEMRASRELSVLPKLHLDLRPLERSPAAVVAITNVGQGPAIDVDVALVFEPIEKDAPAPERHWRTGVLAPGEVQLVVPPHAGEGVMHFEELGRQYRTVRLTGTLVDSLGVRRPVHDEIQDVAEIWELNRAAGLVLPLADPVQTELAEIRKLAKREAQFWRRRAQSVSAGDDTE